MGSSGGRQERPRGGLPRAAGPANFVQLPVLSVPSSPWIELALADGTIVRVPQQNLAALQTVLHSLRSGDPVELDREVSRA